MENIMSKFLIVTKSYVSHVMREKGSDKASKILMVEAGVLGDSIVAVDAIQHLVNYYQEISQKEVVIVCRDNMKSFFQKNISGYNCSVVGLKMNGKWPTVKSFCEIIRECKNYKIEETYVWMHHAWGHMLAYSVASKKNHFVCYRDWYVGRRLCLKYIIRNYYSNIVSVADDTFIPDAYKVLVKRAVGIDYRTKHPLIRMNDNNNLCCKDTNYVVLAPMANVTDRHFSKELISDIVKYILEMSELKVYVSGLQKDYKYVQDAINHFNNERVINYCGKSNFDEFIALLANARFLIGTDSGHIHLAAAMEIPTICILGWWHVGQFLPYHYDDVNEYNPVCIYSEDVYECKNCQAKYGKAGNGKKNHKCGERIKNKENNLCLYEFKPEQAYTTLEMYIHQYEEKVSNE